MIITSHYHSPFGWLACVGDKQGWQSVSWLNQAPSHPCFDPSVSEFWSLWFENPHTVCPFNLVYKPAATEFQHRVGSILGKIEVGHTMTYKEVAIAVGSPNAQQAVGQACKANPFALIVPCHRVLGTGNRLTGYVGTTQLNIKAELLSWERRLTSKQ